MTSMTWQPQKVKLSNLRLGETVLSSTGDRGRSRSHQPPGPLFSQSTHTLTNTLLSTWTVNSVDSRVVAECTGTGYSPNLGLVLDSSGTTVNLTSGEVVRLESWVIQRVGALQLQPSSTSASHWSHVDLQHNQLMPSYLSSLCSRNLKNTWTDTTFLST